MSERFEGSLSRAEMDVILERRRQVNGEGYTIEHDDRHTDGALALAAACYATPIKLYLADERACGRFYRDPWPWDGQYDKRYRYQTGNVIPAPSSYPTAERRDFLVKAGALLLAELDRLDRIEAKAMS